MFASIPGDFTNNGAATATVGASYTDVLALDVTIPDAWNGAALVGDTPIKVAGAPVWNGDTLTAFPALGTTTGVGFYEAAPDGFDGAEPVVRDSDADSVYTSSADTDIVGTAPSAGTAIVTAKDVDWASMYFYDTNTGAWESGNDQIFEDDGNIYYDAAGDVNEAGAATENDPGVGAEPAGWNLFFYDNTNLDAWDNSNDWVGLDLDSDLKYTSAADTLVDADGTTTLGAGAADIAVGATLVQYTAGNNAGNTVCTDDVNTPNAVRVDTDDDCTNGSGNEGTYVLDGSPAVATAEIQAIAEANFVTNNNAVAEVYDLTMRADVAGDLDATGFLIYDTNGSVCVWFDVDNSGTLFTATAAGCQAANRNLEVTGVATGDSDSNVASAVQTIIDGDGKFGATVSTNTVTVTTVDTQVLTDPADIDVGGAFAVSMTTQGENLVTADYFTLEDYNASHWRFWFDAAGNGEGTPADHGDLNGLTEIDVNGANTADAVENAIRSAVDGLASFSAIEKGGDTTITVVSLATTGVGGNGKTNTENVSDAGFTVANFASGSNTIANVELDSDWSFESAGTANQYEIGEDLVIESTANSLTYSTAQDTTIAGTAPAGGTAITTTLDVDWTTLYFYDDTSNGGAWDGANDQIFDNDGLIYYDIGLDTVIAGNAVENQTGALAEPAGWNLWFYDKNDGGATFAAADDWIGIDVGGSGTYSAGADTDVYSTGGLSNGNTLTGFSGTDCNGDSSGTDGGCVYSGATPITSGATILEDNGTNALACDRQDDLLNAITVKNTGNAVDTTDIVAVNVYADAGAAGFQGSGTDTLLGTATWDTFDSWDLTGLTTAVSGGLRVFVAVDIAATPTSTRTITMEIPTSADAGGIGSYDVGDEGVFMASTNEGPTGGPVTNGNTQTIDSTPPTVTARATVDSTGNGKIDYIVFTTDEALDDDFSGLTITVAGYVVSSYDTGLGGNDNVFRVALTENAGTCNASDQSGCDTGVLPNTQITVNSTLSDVYGNNIATDGGGVAPSDGAQPVVVYRNTADLDDNGKIDRVVFGLTEALNDNFAGFTTADVTITGYTDTAVNSGPGANDNEFQVVITEIAGTCDTTSQAGCDTSAVPTTQITTNTSLGDNNNNNLLATDSGTIASLDASSPAVLGRMTLDSGGTAGQIDRIGFILSENITDNFGDITVSVTAPAYVSGVFATGIGLDNMFNMAITESGSPDTGVTPTVQITANTLLADSTGNPVSLDIAGVLSFDNATPVLLSFTSGTGDGTYGPNSNIDVSATYSESPAGGSALTVDLNNTVTGITVNSIAGSVISGTYTVGLTGSGENVTDLTVSAITAESVSDVAGNTQSASAVPSTNIATGSDIDIDTKSPTPTVTTSPATIYEGAMTTTVTVTYDEAMNPTTSPVITLTGGNWGAQTPVGWSGGNIIYTATFTHDGTEEYIGNEVASIAAGSGATDVVGNIENSDSSPAFIVDTQKPTPTVTTSPAIIKEISPLACYGGSTR